jgi:hypothetical protein
MCARKQSVSEDCRGSMPVAGFRFRALDGFPATLTIGAERGHGRLRRWPVGDRDADAAVL